MRSQALALLALLLAPAIQDPGFTIADARHTPEERLESMRGAMKLYEFSREGEPPVALKLRPEPAFRIGRQGNNLLDGAVFLFTDEVDRPGAAMQPFLERSERHPDGKWLHEFTSLSTGPIVAKRDGEPRWRPTAPGLEFKAVPDAPTPAASAPARLRQMRAIADEFRADDDFGGGGWHPLRMLTTPIARYGKAGARPEDGALFAFVEGTDPEVFLFLESRKAANGSLQWQYGLAPMGCWAVKAKHKGSEVWSLSRRSTGDPSQPLYSYQFWPRTEADAP
jgi:hypothetical protein